MKPEDQAAKLQPLQRFERVGELAIRPQAFFEFFLPPPTDRRNALVGSVEIVDICGPLTTRAFRRSVGGGRKNSKKACGRIASSPTRDRKSVV